jgi:hypothetical protein
MYFCIVLCIFCVVLCIFVLFYVFLCCSMYYLFCDVLCNFCIYVLNNCHRVATQLQLTNISYNIISYHIISIRGELKLRAQLLNSCFVSCSPHLLKCVKVTCITEGKGIIFALT